MHAKSHKAKRHIPQTPKSLDLKPADALRIIPLGGQEEVGRNMTVFECGNDIIILDMGVQFPEEYMLGIDYIIPNIGYLKGKEKRVRAVIFSHGHMDHIGAAPILLEQLGNPMIIGRPLTIGLLKNRQEDYKPNTANRLKVLTVNSLSQKIRLGSFVASFFPVDHSIMDAMGVVLETKHGTVIHPGDWTYEKQPVGHSPVTYEALSRLRKPTILMLESLGATQMKERVPEQVMYQNLKKLVQEAPGRIIIATFSSQIQRIKEMLEFAELHKKKVALDGYSMKVNIEIAKQLGYIKIKKDTLVPIDKIDKYPERRTIILCTGAQGEQKAALSRIVNGEHRFIKIRKNDTVVFSSSVIPGNENTIQRLKDKLYRLSDFVVHSEIMDIHSSGHSTANDMVEVVKQIRPTYFLPVYANHYFLKEAKKLLVRRGYPEKNVEILDDGSVLEFHNGKPRLLQGKVPTDYVYVDGLGVGDISHVILRDRQMLAGDGMVIVVAKVSDRNGKLIDEPEIIMRGFINENMRNHRAIVEQAKAKIKKIVVSRDPATKATELYLRNKIADDLGQFFFSKTRRRPMVIPVLIEV